MTCCGQPNTCERPCFHGGQAVIGLGGFLNASQLEGMGVLATTSFSTRLQPGTIIPDPKITWTAPEPKRLALNEQCEAAMGRLKAHINSRCAEHREAIRANSNWDIGRMHQRHDNYKAEADRRQRMDALLRFLRDISSDLS